MGQVVWKQVLDRSKPTAQSREDAHRKELRQVHSDKDASALKKPRQLSTVRGIEEKEEQQMTKKGTLVAAVGFALAISLLLSAACAQQEASPKLIAMTTYGVGTAGFTSVSILAECIEGKTGMTCKTIPVAEEIPRVLMVLKGDAQYSFNTAGSVFNFSRGLEDYKTWGATRVRCVWRGAPTGSGLAVRGNSDMYKVSDVKGKRVAVISSSPGAMANTQACLAYGNLTLNDVRQVPVPSVSSGY